MREQHRNIPIAVWEFAVMTQGAQIRCSVTTEGVSWDGRWEGGSRGRGTYVYLWLIHVDVWQKPTQYGKAIILQLKKFLS